MHGPCPLQIISTAASSDDGVEREQEFKLEKDNLLQITSKIPKDTKIAVVSVVGAFRTGKSFLLALMLRYLKHGRPDDLSRDWMHVEGEALAEGNRNNSSRAAAKAEEESPPASFEWRGGHDRMTTGIWMWSEPFLHKSQASGEVMAILLMDTQGMFDNETTMTLTAQIFGISTLISSLQIYNIQNRISEDHLQHLALFSEYGRIAHQRNDSEPAAVSDDTQSWFSSTAPKPFQRLQFLVRDWANFEETWPEEEGEDKKKKEDAAYTKLRAEMQSYLTKLIKARGDADLQSTRDQIARCFERVDCFLLTHPGIPATRPNYDGSLKLLDASFQGLIDRFARLVFDEHLEPKRVHKRFITGIELVNYFEAYVGVFQSGEGFPKAMTILDATAEANNRNAYDLAISKYTELMGPVTGKGANESFVRENDLRSKHQNAEALALSLFEEIATMGSVKGSQRMLEMLVAYLKAEIEQRLSVNALRNPFREYEKYALPFVVAVVSWILSTLLNATCSTTVCKQLERNLVGVYMILVFFFLFAFWSKIKAFGVHLKAFAQDAGLVSEKVKVKAS